MREHDIQNKVRIGLSKLGFVVFRINVGNFYTKDGRYIKGSVPVGFSDLIAIKDGRIYFLEIKDSKGKASAEQINFIDQMKLKGCKGGICRSVEDAIKIIEEE